MQLVKVIYITLMLCLFTFGANGQENIRENHIKLKNDSSGILSDKARMPFNKTDLLLPNPNAKDVETAIDNTNFKTDRPFYIHTITLILLQCFMGTIVQADIFSLILWQWLTSHAAGNRTDKRGFNNVSSSIQQLF